jgi:hypothetical protein
MKKTRLKEIIKEVLLEEKGYSKYAPGGTTSGLTQDTLEQILLKIAKQGEDMEEKYEGDPERGNKILDKADPENVARILRGEKPEVDRMQELAGIQSEVKINNPLPPISITLFKSDARDNEVQYYYEDFDTEKEWIEFINKIKENPKFREEIYNEMSDNSDYGDEEIEYEISHELE